MNAMTKIQTGARVRIDHTINDKLKQGLEGTVIQTNDTAYPLLVDFGHVGAHLLAESEVLEVKRPQLYLVK